jgi:hypothetical protein
LEAAGAFLELFGAMAFAISDQPEVVTFNQKRA